MRNPFQPLQSITIQFPEEEPPSRYQSMVLDFNEGRDLLIVEPQEQGRIVMASPRAAVVIEMMLPDGMHRYTTTVLRRQISPPALVLDWPQGGERIQRREHVRVPVSIPAKLKPLEEQGEKPLEEQGELPEVIEGVTSDLSAGGVRVTVPLLIPQGTIIELEFALPNHGVVTCSGRVVRSAEIAKASGPSQYWSGIEFRDLAEANRREITKYVFNLQLEYRRRGAL